LPAFVGSKPTGLTPGFQPTIVPSSDAKRKIAGADGENGEEIVVRHPRRRQQHDEQRGQKHNAAARNSPEQPDHDDLLPKMPCGRNSSTAL
jgi:hypothetical protein